MNHYWHYLLIVIALVINYGDQRAIALTAIVSVSLLIPVNKFTMLSNFYLVCSLFELLVLCFALRINTRASHAIIMLCLMLTAYHLVGWNAGGHHQNSPYRLLAKIAEYAEIVACILFANPIMRLLKNDAR